MADTGHIAIDGFKAGAIKYATLAGFVPNPSGSTLIPCVASMGFGLNAIPKITLIGFAASPSVASGAFYVFGDAVIR